jgi:hypothetical protein
VISQKFESVAKIGQDSRCRCDRSRRGADPLCPPASELALYAAAPQPKKLLLVANGSHNNRRMGGRCRLPSAVGGAFSARLAQFATKACRTHAVHPQRTHGPTSTGSQPAAF